MEGDFGRTSVRMCCPRFILFWLTLAATLSVAPPAHAHLVNTGFGPFDDGLTHLFVTPEDLLPVIALALLAGLRGPRFGRAVLFALPVAWMVGSTIGLLLAPPITLPVAQTILTIALGLLLATEQPSFARLCRRPRDPSRFTARSTERLRTAKGIMVKSNFSG